MRHQRAGTESEKAVTESGTLAYNSLVTNQISPLLLGEPHQCSLIVRHSLTLISCSNGAVNFRFFFLSFPTMEATETQLHYLSAHCRLALVGSSKTPLPFAKANRIIPEGLEEGL